MKRIATILTAAVIAAGLGTSVVQAGGGGGGRGGPGGTPGGGGTNALGMNVNFYTNEYDLLAAQVTLTEAQKPKVRAKVDAMNAELQTIIQASQNVGARGAAPAGGGGGRGGAGGFGAPVASVPLTPEQIKLRDDFQMLADQHQVKINGDLTNEQKLQWEAYKLNTFLDPKLVTLNLTDAQKEKVKGLVADTAKSLAAMTDGKEIDVYEGKLIRKVVADVLTESQAARLFELPLGTTSGGRGAAPAAAGGRGGGGAPGGAGGGPGGGFGGAPGGGGPGGAIPGGAGAGGGGRGARGG